MLTRADGGIMMHYYLDGVSHVITSHCYRCPPACRGSGGGGDPLVFLAGTSATQQGTTKLHRAGEPVA